MNSFVKKIQNFIFHNKLFSRGERILIGVSGGPDSIFLSRVLLELREKQNWELGLLHVNYGLRGEDSLKDEMFVREFAKIHGLEVEVIKFDSTFLQKSNQEANLRDFRYMHFEKFAKKEGFDKIALAHNIDDQAETFLMNVFRGSGTKGLAAMSPLRGNIARPILAISKKEILKYLEEIGQDFRVDSSNLENLFFRNRIRNELIPILNQYSPRIKERIFQLSINLQDEGVVVEEIVEKKYNDIVQNSEKEYIVLMTDLLELSVGMKKLLFRKIVKEIKGDLINITSNNFFEFNKILESKKSKQQECLIGEIKIIRRSSQVIFSKI